MTLAERLEAFPLFCSTDGAHWFKGAIAKEPLCLEAAARIRQLEASLSGLLEKLDTYADNKMYGISDDDDSDEDEVAEQDSVALDMAIDLARAALKESK